ncbi:fimbria/pilus outer membrane usher protein [Pseudomonas chlororaphis subsp. aurantiaca]|uniref:fimbria/pilus outer membrane usher protein n=1 Tax=Pseudomonas chlororaphis TaxID=587753 RepID=UPI0027DD7547|nr:fimbria/pilus outer membrane usher protein [Pseudomonas chlororaphis]WMI97534.1 fimbria/pilus outer membrane usher protein [Pseudomonas chlororaphis subsp. aurantiaca]
MRTHCREYRLRMFVGVRLFNFKPARLASLITVQWLCGFVVCPASVYASDYFNPNALEVGVSGQNAIDLEHFSRAGGQLPGTYQVDIYVNDNRLSTRDVTFVMKAEKLQPELTPQQLEAMGVKLDAFPALSALAPTAVITDLGHYIPDASSTFKFSQQRLDISIPQAALTSEARGYVDPSLWDQGLPALLLNYNVSGAHTAREKVSGTDDNYYMNLRSGLNLGEWRLRNYSTLSDHNGISRWQNVSTYLQRDIQGLKSQMTLGDSSTPGDIFAGVQYRGAQLVSDDSMYPDSLRGFAPVVRGIAQSNAQVTIRQNGYIIYQTYVAAGAFAITDLYPTSASGDMEVTITEANGSERRYIQPFSSVPVMLREGRLKYALTAGEYRSTNRESSKPAFTQGTLIYGLPNAYTVYGGLQAANNYSALVAGVGHGFGDWGSLSTDVTQAKTRLRDSSQHAGQSYRFQYAKDVKTTGTTFTLAGYRYSTSGYYDFQEANELNPQNFKELRPISNKRSRAQVNINQSMGRYGNFYINGYQQDYWRQSGIERSLSAGFNTSHAGITYGVSYTFSQSPIRGGSTRNDQQLAFNIQIPLDKLLPSSWASYSINSSKLGNTSQQVGINGSALADNNLSYNVQQSYASKGGGNTGSTSVTYKGNYGEARAGYNYGNGSEQLNYGMQGGVVVHPYGVTFSQPQGETLALVRTPGAGGVKLQNNTGVRTDARGYAVVPYVGNYRRNRIALDSESLADDVDLETNAKTVIPTKGAVVLADFHTRVGSRVLMTLRHQGKPLPFGATANLVEESSSATPNEAIVGLEGEVYLSGVPEAGRLQVQWGDQAHQRCEVGFTLPAVKAEAVSALRVLDAVCQ